MMGIPNVTCAGCGIQLTPAKHRARIWCGGACRARTRRLGLRKPAKEPRQREIRLRPCCVCLQPFALGRAGRKTCSQQCLDRARERNVEAMRGRPMATCSGCGATYLPKASNRRTYCSKACGYAYRAKMAATREMAPRPCRACGRPCPRKLLFCTSKHSAEFATGTYLAKAWYTDGRARRLPPRDCQWCGKGFIPRAWRTKPGAYCTSRCRRPTR